MAANVLITGGTGFVGSNIAKYHIENGDRVTITGNENEQKVTGAVKVLHPGLNGIDWSSIGSVDILYHESAINDTQFADRDEIFRANLDASKQLFEFVAERGCEHIVFASSTAVYGASPAPYVEASTPTKALNPYAESKLALEEYAMDFAAKNPGIVVVGLRYCNVYGPGERHKGKRAAMICQLADQMVEGNPVIFFDGEQKRDYIYVKDVVKANVCASECQRSCVVNCGSGEATTFNRLIALLNEILGTARMPEYIDNPYGANYQDHTECDMTAAREKIGFVPQFDIEAGIRDHFASGTLLARR